jgi:hypothetical protein
MCASCQRTCIEPTYLRLGAVRPWPRRGEGDAMPQLIERIADRTVSAVVAKTTAGACL